MTAFIKEPHFCVAIGDSLTHNSATTTPVGALWSSQLREKLAELGYHIRIQNAGISGNTTPNMYFRRPTYLQNQPPEVAFIFAGTNDAAPEAVNGSGATTTSIPVGSGRGVKFEVGASVIIGGQSRVVSAIVGDTLTLATALSSAPADTASVYHDTATNITGIVNYLIAAGTTRICILSLAYVNYSGGGSDYYNVTTVTSAASASVVTVGALTAGGATIAVDGYVHIAGQSRKVTGISGTTLTLETALSPTPTAGTVVSKERTDHARTRAILSALATTLAAANPTKSIIYCDLYQYQYDLIATGDVDQGDDLAWYNEVGDYHFNSAGSGVVADAVIARIQSASGWLTALS